MGAAVNPSWSKVVATSFDVVSMNRRLSDDAHGFSELADLEPDVLLHRSAEIDADALE